MSSPPKPALPPIGPGGWFILVVLIGGYLAFAVEVVQSASGSARMMGGLTIWTAIGMAYVWKRVGRNTALGFILGFLVGGALTVSMIMLGAAIRGATS